MTAYGLGMPKAKVDGPGHITVVHKIAFNILVNYVLFKHGKLVVKSNW